jgi:hypothetical protein
MMMFNVPPSGVGAVFVFIPPESNPVSILPSGGGDNRAGKPNFSLHPGEAKKSPPLPCVVIFFSFS